MTEKPLVSIIVRSKNEERWIGACLGAIRKQSYPNIEIVLVDNQSTDLTIAKAKLYDVKLVEIDKFIPGKAINDGIRASSGDILVCLSGHCIPVEQDWLTNLIADLSDPEVAGVYGRQQPMSFSSAFDKRDLMLVFGLDKKIQRRDNFFHNANSAFRREVWEKYPFDETVSNIEDRVWAQRVLKDGYKIVYEPDGSVFHYHGIHQDLDAERAANVVRIMEEIEGSSHIGKQQLEDLQVSAIIPVRGPILDSSVRRLYEHTVRDALQSKHLSKVVVSTDNEEMAKIARELGAEAPFLRPEALSEDFINITEVLQYSLDRMEETYGVGDLVVCMMTTHPFRPPGMIDAMIERTVERGLDSLVAAKGEMRQIWQESNDRIEPLGDTRLMPRQLKESHTLVGLFGLGCVTHPVFLRDGEPLGPRTGVFEIKDPFAAVEIRSANEAAIAVQMLADWQSLQESGVD